MDQGINIAALQRFACLYYERVAPGRETLQSQPLLASGAGNCSHACSGQIAGPTDPADRPGDLWVHGLMLTWTQAAFTTDRIGVLSGTQPEARVP